MLAKKKKLIKLNSNKLLQPIYQELADKNYEKVILSCQDYLKNFSKSYTIRCILAYTYRCLKFRLKNSSFEVKPN